MRLLATRWTVWQQLCPDVGTLLVPLMGVLVFSQKKNILDVLPARALVKPLTLEETPVGRLGALTHTLGAVEWLAPGAHLGTGALARVLVEGLVWGAGGRLGLAGALAGVLVQVVVWPAAAAQTQLLLADALTRVLVQLLVWPADIWLKRF